MLVVCAAYEQEVVFLKAAEQWTSPLRTHQLPVKTYSMGYINTTQLFVSLFSGKSISILIYSERSNNKPCMTQIGVFKTNVTLYIAQGKLALCPFISKKRVTLKSSLRHQFPIAAVYPQEWRVTPCNSKNNLFALDLDSLPPWRDSTEAWWLAAQVSSTAPQ